MSSTGGAPAEEPNPAVAGETASQKKNRRRRNKKKTSAVPANPASHDDTWGLVEDAALGRCV